MPKSVTVPSTLSGHAADIWRKTFLSAYSDTCSERDDKDECAARIAWGAVKNKYKKKDGKWVAKAVTGPIPPEGTPGILRAGDPVVGPISTDIDKQPPMAYPSDSIKGSVGTKIQRWIKAYNKALAEDCRQSDNPTECARAYANKAVGRVETDVEPVEKVLKPNGRVIKRIVERGGPGSGHRGHKGRPGEVGGSLPDSALGKPNYQDRDEFRRVADPFSEEEDFEEERPDPYEPVIDWLAVPDVGPEGEVVEAEPYQRTAQERAMDGRRRHKFMTKELESQLPPLYSQESNRDPTVYTKFFHPYATNEFYATEYDPVEGIFFGWINSGQPELGYFSRKELAEIDSRGLPMERDLYFDPKPLSEVKETAQRQIPPDEYAFRLESTLRGEEKTMDEHPLATKMREEVMAGYVKRKEVRTKLNDVDYALIERMGDQEIIRPDRFSTITWRTMPPSQKNVRAEATRRIIERNYAQSVEDAQVAGWKAKKNHYQPDEFYFVKPHDTDAGRVIMRAVLVRNEDSVDWELKILSQFATDSIAVQLPKHILRHTKEQLLNIPVIRGGPGSGHRGHRGRPGEVGGSLPSGDSGSAGRKARSPKTHVQPSYDFESGDIPETDDELYDLLDEVGLGDLGPDRIREPKEPEPQLSERLPGMSISQIASAVRKDWKKVNFGAKPYLDAMGSLENISDNYMFDSGVSVVSYFLANAGTWRGDTARMVKAELKKRLKKGR